jgi:hypothetical protein
MADIPENPSTAGSGAQSQAPSTGVSQGRSNERLDPRSGMISPAAWRLNTDESNLHPPVVSGGLQERDLNVEPGVRGLGRSQTEDFEMRRFR